MAGTETGRRIRGLDARERQAQRRQQLLDAALELFATKGYFGTSIEQICQTAYVGTKAFYELFDSKEACYLALLEEAAAQMSQAMLSALDEAPDDPREGARALLAAFAHAVVDDPRVARATFGQAGGISPTVEQRRRENRRWAASFLEAVWTRYGITAPAGRNLHHIAVGAIGGLFDLVVDWLHDVDKPDGATNDIEALIDGLTEFYETISAGLVTRR